MNADVTDRGFVTYRPWPWRFNCLWTAAAGLVLVALAFGNRARPALLILGGVTLVGYGLRGLRCRVENRSQYIVVVNLFRARRFGRADVRAVIRPTLMTQTSLLLAGPAHCRPVCAWCPPAIPGGRARCAEELADLLGVPVVP